MSASLAERPGPGPGGPDDPPDLEELAALVLELGAYADWERMTGARLIPWEPPLPPSALPASAQRPIAPPPSAQRPVAPPPPRAAAPPVVPRPAPPRAAPPAPPPRPVGLAVPPPPPPRPAPVTAALAPLAPAPSPPAPAGQLTLGAWGQFLAPVAPRPEASEADSARLAAATSLAEVREILGTCQRCGLCQGRTNIVYGVGDPAASLFVIGEGPGQQEDQLGEPFVGPAGQMLDRMLSAVLGLPRERVYIANVVKCRPPNNRNPEPEEVAACLPFLHAQLARVRPRVVLVLGSVAVKAVFETKQGVTGLRGAWRTLTFPGGEARAMATFHPAYLLRKPEDKPLTFADLKLVRAALDAP